MLASLLLAPFAAAQLAAVAPPETVVVSATRIPQAAFDIPASIDAVDASRIGEDNPRVNLSETLNRVPGIVVQNRQNYAQDLQISSRGFGARSTFGVRGVRLIADAIPATMPDGQGQAATFDLGSAVRIEVLRGPFASLYGNSSGGVVQVFTADGPPQPALDLAYVGGSDGLRKGNVRFGGEAGAVNYIFNASRFETDGYRDHSAATRDQASAKLRLGGLGPGALTLVASWLDQPDTQDPLGLTRAQWEANPRQVDPAAIAFDTRKSIRQGQGGLVYDMDIGSEDKLQARVYAGDRQVTQYLGQAGDTPLGSGGVVDLDRNYGGLGLRWSKSLAGARPLGFSAGVEYDRMKEGRRGYVNNNGVAGALRRDEDDTVRNLDWYAQFDWHPSPCWVVSGGYRYSTVRFDSRDHYFTPANQDDSGTAKYSRGVPVGGILYKVSDDLNLYANAGGGFETPTFAELAYRPGGAPGLNFALQPAKSRHYEAGFKAQLDEGVRVTGALFRIDTRDEIVTNSSSGGRTDFRNASPTRRDGVEVAIEARLARGFELNLAYTALDARFRAAFASGSPPAAVAAGRHLPGVPGTVLYAEGVWRHPGGFHAAIEMRQASRVYVTEANTDAAEGYQVFNLRAGFEHRLGGWRLREFVRVDNATDKRYAGSVIVAEARGRFFEPAPGRNYLAGIEVTRAF